MSKPPKKSSLKSPDNAAVWIGLVAMFSVLAAVWLVVKLSDDPAERKNLPEEGRLAAFVLLPKQGAPWLGVHLDTRGDVLQRRNTAGNAVVTRVLAGSPAAAAGLRAGDVITRLNGERIAMPADLAKSVARHRAGETVRLTVNRRGMTRKIQITLAPQPMGTLAAVVTETQPGWLGADVQPVDSLMAKQLGLPTTSGVIVSHVFPDSPAAAAGLIPGALLVRIGETPVDSVDQLRRVMARARPGDVLDMGVWQGGKQTSLAVTLAPKPSPKAQPAPSLPEAVVEIEAAWLGLDIVPLTRAEADELGISPNQKGMVVDAVAQGAGVDAGLQVGDVIVSVNGRSTATVKDFKEATEGAVGAVIDVIRYGRHLYISVPPPDRTRAGANRSPARQVGFTLW